MLVDYSDDSEESDNSVDCSNINKEVITSKSKIKLPSASAYFEPEDENKAVYEDKTLHQGRTRSFQHERGNWATYVYAEYDEDVSELLSELNAVLSPLGLRFTEIKEPHMSLSKPFPIRHHWIDGMLESLRRKLSSSPRSTFNISNLAFYTSEDKTRTFVSLKVIASDLALRSYVEKIDSVLREFNLPTYYTDPSFHVSIGWILGDRICDFQDLNLAKTLQNKTDEFFNENIEYSQINISHLLLKAGNKIFDIPLSKK